MTQQTEKKPTCPNYGKGARPDCWAQCTGWRDSCNAQYEQSFHSDMLKRINSPGKVIYTDGLTFQEWSQKREQSTPVTVEEWLVFTSKITN